MTSVFRTMAVLATAGAAAFSTQLPDSIEAARKRVVGITNPGSPFARADFKTTDVEFYMTEDGLAYIRPGLNVKVNSVTIPADRKPLVDVTITDGKNQPLDRLGETTPGAVSVSFVLAWYDPDAGHYTSYTTRNVTTPDNSPNPGAKAVQAASDSGGVWTSLGPGHYTYKFGTTLPSGFDQSRTHTLGFYSTRNLTEEIGKNYYDDEEIDFRPDGQAVTAVWDKVRDASCHECHDAETFGLHGGSRRDVKLCVLCHSPQTVDPDTGNTVDFKVMLHKIHAGSELSEPYIIYGNQQSKHDYSGVVFPTLTGGLRNCTKCHEGETNDTMPTQSHVWLTEPSRAACGSCHDTIDWVTGAGHPAGPQSSDAACGACHNPDSGDEFDASVKGAHTIPEASKQLPGLNATIVSVSNVAAGQRPTVVIRLTDNAGTPVDGSKLNTFAPIHAGPTTSVRTYFRENLSTTNPPVFNPATGNTTYTFTNPIPAGSTGSWAFAGDFSRNILVKRADGEEDISVRDSAMNPVLYAAIGSGAVTPRRKAVDINLCNNCHGSLGLRFHGGTRRNTDECVLCHNPLESDIDVRPAGTGPEESVSFQRLIHRIHSGHNLTQDFTVYGNNSSLHNYNHVLYPGDRRNCLTCHVNDSEQLPAPSTADAVITKRDYFTPQGPGTAACLGCHDVRDAAAHAYLNTAIFGGQPAEACGTCHGTDRDWAVDKVHAR